MYPVEIKNLLHKKTFFGSVLRLSPSAVVFSQSADITKTRELPAKTYWCGIRCISVCSDGISFVLPHRKGTRGSPVIAVKSRSL